MADLGRTALSLGWGLGIARRRGALALRRAARLLLPFGRARYRRFLFAPPDLRTADPTMAADFYAGQFIFAGQLVELHGQSPFDAEPPSRAWAEGLYGFGWLRHLHAANTALARDNARSLVAQFIKDGRQRGLVAAQPLVASRRVMAFLSHSPLVLEGADHDFYHAYLACVQADLRAMRDASRLSDDPAAQLAVLCAATAAGLCIEGAERLADRAGAALAEALDDQILPDGGHVSRNPRVLVELMLDLLPLKATYAARGMETPAAIIDAIARIVPHIRMLRHGDGALALFNGMGATQVETLATIFACCDVAGGPAMEAPHSFYARLEAGASLLLVDAGAPPPFAASGEAMAGAASFEFSHARQRIFVNCGAPRRAPPGAGFGLRSTAAQNATVVADTSSARFLARGDVVRLHGGPGKVTLQRVTEPHLTTIRMSHDGYARRFSVRIERDIALSADGDILQGEERLVLLGDRAALPPFATRFHIHPHLKAVALSGAAVDLILPTGGLWRFAVEGGRSDLEESAFFAGADGARRTAQIVLSPEANNSVMRWSLKRVV